MEPTERIYNIYYDEQTEAVIMEWSGYARSEEFRAGTKLMFDTMQKNGASKVIGNITDFVLIGMEDQKWLLDDFLPLAIKHGFSKCALTIPLFYFNRVAVETVVSNIVNSRFKVRLFKSFDEAKNWIMEK